MSQVFISYATENGEFARLVEMMLKEAGYQVWLDHRELRVGEEWRRAIDEGISTSDVLLLVITHQSCESKYVTYEWAYALGKGVKVIPLLLEDAPMHPRLVVLQHLEFTNKKSMPWEKLFREIDESCVDSDRKRAATRVGDMTPDQLQELVTSAVSLAAATAKSSGQKAAPEDISRAARSVVDLMQHSPWMENESFPASRRHILWVDDSPENNTYERNAFEAIGFEFTLALSTNEALRVLSLQRFVAIISDMARNEGPREGYVLLDALRSKGDDTPFFIYTSSNSPEHKREAEEHGAQGSTNSAQELFDLITRMAQ